MAILMGHLDGPTTLHGVLVNSNGAPIAGVSLRTGYYKSENGGGIVRLITLDTVTDSSGHFTFAAAPYPVNEERPMQLIATLAAGSYGYGKLSQEGGKVVLSGQSALSLCTVDDLGNPLSGVRVNALELNLKKTPQGPYLAIVPLNQVFFSTKSNSKGLATFDGLPIGANVLIRAQKEGSVDFTGSIPVSGKLDDVQKVVLPRGGLLTGRVLQDGKPVSGIRVAAETIVNHEARFGFATTDAQGDYRLSDAPVGSATLSVSPTDPNSDYVAKPYREVQIQPGREIDGLNFDLERGVALAGKVLTLKGGKPVEGAMVMDDPDGEPMKQVQTKADGSFLFHVPPGRNYVAVQQVAGRMMSSQVYLFATVDADHNPPLELRVPDVVLFAAIKNLEGAVQDAKGDPVSDAKVVDLVNLSNVVSDSKGHFEFPGETNPGDLIVAIKGGAMTKDAIEVADKKKIEVPLNGKSAIIEGAVYGIDGNPIPDVELTMGGQSGHGYVSIPPTKTDKRGVFRFTDVYPGMASYFIWSKLEGYGSTTIQDIRVSPGEDKLLTSMTMAPTDGTIDGQVFELDGKPAVGATVTAQTQESPQVFTDKDGRFHLTKVSRGRHTVAAGRENYLLTAVDASTGDTKVVLKLPKTPVDAPGAVQQDHTGQKAPRLQIVDWIGGKGPSDEDLKGKILVIDFWATWCHPCVDSLPKVQALADRFKNKGVVVIGVHAPGTPIDKVTSFVRAQHLTYPIGMDIPEPGGIGKNHVAFGPNGIPHVMVVDANGKVVSDSNEIEDAERVIKKLLNGA
jgi:thiol-disulfide isomerase/thioredoxin